jgi:glycosyltransferase involved in cell wall biosynthesis
MEIYMQVASYPTQSNIKPKVLLLSGVNISNVIKKPTEAPIPDFEYLKQALHPAIIDTHVVENTSNLILKTIKRMTGLPWSIALLALFKAHHYDVIIATGEDVGLRLAFLFNIFGKRAPLIMTCHNVATRRPSFFLEKLGAGASIQTFQCLSDTQANMLMNRFGVNIDKIQLIYWHIDHNFFRPMMDVQIKNQICSAGMASRDYATLIAAIRDLDIEVKIAADSPWFKQELNISQNDLPPRVEVRSYGTYQALRNLYAESLFVVIPLFDVPFSAGYTVILEAMAMGKTPIVSRIKQQDDFIIDGWNGLYVEPGNISELHSRIQFLLQNPDEAKRMGDNARKTIEDRFTLNHYVQRMCTAVNKISNLLEVY